MWARLRVWISWEFHRDIEVGGFIKVIIAERFIKGIALFLGGIALIVVSSGSTLDNWVTSVQEQFNFNPHHEGLWARGIHYVVIKFGGLSDRLQITIAIGAMLYGVLELVEGVGLMRRRRWAEYLVLVATVFFLPPELDELIRRPTFVKVGLLVFNIAIATYLVRSKRLFLDRQPVAEAGQATG